VEEHAPFFVAAGDPGRDGRLPSAGTAEEEQAPSARRAVDPRVDRGDDGFPPDEGAQVVGLLVTHAGELEGFVGQVQVPPEQVWGGTQACPQLPQFVASEPVSVHDTPQQATGQVICTCHCPLNPHVCCSVPMHRVWPGAQTPMQSPPMQVCPTQGGPHVHQQGQLQGVLPMHCLAPTAHVLQQTPSRQGAPPQDGWVCHWPFASQSCGVSPMHWP
jgi:hypothetical protein